MSLINTLIDYAPYTAGLCGFMLFRQLYCRCRAERKLREEQAKRRRAMDQAATAIAEAQDAHRAAGELRAKLDARRCPRCLSVRLGRFCGNCGADQLPPGTPLVKDADGTFRQARAGETPAFLFAVSRTVPTHKARPTPPAER